MRVVERQRSPQLRRGGAPNSGPPHTAEVYSRAEMIWVLIMVAILVAAYVVWRRRSKQ